jgi:hypothetical protein
VYANDAIVAFVIAKWPKSTAKGYQYTKQAKLVCLSLYHNTRLCRYPSDISLNRRMQLPGKTTTFLPVLVPSAFGGEFSFLLGVLPQGLPIRAVGVSKDASLHGGSNATIG